PGFSEVDPKPREPLHNRHPVQKAVESIAAESQTVSDPFGPAPETEPTDRAELLPDGSGDRRGPPPRSDGPWPEHGVSRDRGQRQARDLRNKKVRPAKPCAGGPTMPSCHSTTAAVRRADDGLPFHSSAFRLGGSAHGQPAYGHSPRRRC